MTGVKTTLTADLQTQGIWYLMRRHGHGPWMPFTQLRPSVPHEGYEILGPFESFDRAIETLQSLMQTPSPGSSAGL